jgi:hypothetical protein
MHLLTVKIRAISMALIELDFVGSGRGFDATPHKEVH